MSQWPEPVTAYWYCKVLGLAIADRLGIGHRRAERGAATGQRSARCPVPTPRAWVAQLSGGTPVAGIHKRLTAADGASRLETIVYKLPQYVRTDVTRAVSVLGHCSYSAQRRVLDRLVARLRGPIAAEAASRYSRKHARVSLLVMLVSSSSPAMICANSLAYLR